jgi:phosphatidylserine/phosphatidylglycerophosphate/cardiolipin synthase-like enzyme
MAPPTDRLFCTWTYRASMPPSLRNAFGDLDQLLRDVAVSAKSSLIIVAPYLSAVGIRGLMNSVAVAAQAGAAVKLITGDLDADGSRNRQAVRELLTGEYGTVIHQHLRVLTNSPSFPALLHAKLVIADGRRGYLGSANVSWRGMESNLEIGVELPAQQASVLEALFTFLESSGALVEIAAHDL